MKKNSIFVILIAVINIILYLSLLIFCIPEQIPICLNVNETILHLGSKWLLTIPLLLLIIFAVFSITLKNTVSKSVFKALLFIMIFDTILTFVYYSIENYYEIGSIYKIPISILIFMPLSFIFIVWSNLLKKLPYKSKIGIRNKYTYETEFLWIQIHYLARDKFFFAGLILFVISLIFSLFRLIVVEIILFFAIILIFYILILKESKSIYSKYLEMKTRKENLKKEETKK